MKTKVLLVDDYPGIRDSLGHTLRLQGYDVTVASNGRAALDALCNTSFDLALLDLDMPVINGWEFLQRIITVSLSLPVIIITERTDQQRLATKPGVVAVLEKPLNLDSLLGVMERVSAKSARAHAANESKPGASLPLNLCHDEKSISV